MNLARVFCRRLHQKCLASESKSQMRVDTVARDIIRPSSPTPDHLRHFKLSLLEQLGPTIFGPMVFFYSSSRFRQAEQLQKLKKSLSETLSHFYPLAGRLKGNVSIDCNDSGVDFLEAEADSSLSGFLEEPYLEGLQQLIPTQVDSPEARTKLLLAQASFFRCGGIALGVCLSHKIADASSIGLIMKSWAAMSARGSMKTVGFPVYNTANLFPPGNFSDTDPAPVVEPEIMKKTVSKRFVFGASDIQSLQAKSASSEVSQPTRVEAVSALIWKCAMKATRTVSGTPKPSVIAHATNIRRLVSPPLPETSIGNLVSYFAARAEEENQTKLQNLVFQIRKAKQNFRDKHVPKLIGNPEAPDIICNHQKEAGDMIASGEYDFYIFSSACRFDLYETDFGWGKPTWVGVPSVQQKNMMVLFDTKEPGGIEVWVNLHEEEMELFEKDSEFIEFASPNPCIIEPFLHVL
ncbi:PREDICTED: vinorine synthase [Tarenaya hassleriana]|uniref:vinorine synthase n=1 Tax=Tarenaya hassleriana TaxID=28532 RepID=UPI00053C8C60|nr:PREDICTED: vinorine synthase [Tarenaya hassleriana]XP_019059213.1 PREDICTED: vinorine synthase [Tarenaya hassleriana]XP_019059214.1 PREDICTED: vinorine synthase [Tarenaya hassleriana]XP_019059215.1 PREDICTED: vinorine synthase [Tarenaya hassleriana]XP_019059216.1 PREDICTED: vinorine synthase [Tarenaya hassleriana]XP_019059217.1 PREDICTED: vinorine synthase [Tarenaya hassleriana]XP_019059218.1 PREDICTED: vinorine synthase [Tarenaya hassleriana]XP_019059219.1 PREDICTED: vinorine synthase [T